MSYLSRLLTSARHAIRGSLSLLGGIGSGTLSGNYSASHGDAYLVALDPGGASRSITLPAGRDGALRLVRNTADADERLTVYAADGSTVLAIVPAEGAVLLGCEGTTWTVLATMGGVPMPRHAVQTIDMADAQVALVYGTAGAGQVKVTSEVLAVDANSAGTEDLLLPPEATSFGRVFFVLNTGGEDIVVKEDSDTTTIATVSTTECAFFACDGTTWRGGVVKTT